MGCRGRKGIWKNRQNGSGSDQTVIDLNEAVFFVAVLRSLFRFVRLEETSSSCAHCTRLRYSEISLSSAARSSLPFRAARCSTRRRVGFLDFASTSRSRPSRCGTSSSFESRHRFTLPAVAPRFAFDQRERTILRRSGFAVLVESSESFLVLRYCCRAFVLFPSLCRQSKSPACRFLRRVPALRAVTRSLGLVFPNCFNGRGPVSPGFRREVVCLSKLVRRIIERRGRQFFRGEIPFEIGSSICDLATKCRGFWKR